MLPPWLTTVLLAALLLLLSSKLIHRGVLTYRSETKAQRAAAANAEQSAALEAPLLNGGVHFSAVTLHSSLPLCYLIITWRVQVQHRRAMPCHMLAQHCTGALEDGGGGALHAVGSASSLGAGTGGDVRRRGFRRLVSNASASEDTSFFESVNRTTAHVNHKGAACSLSHNRIAHVSYICIPKVPEANIDTLPYIRYSCFSRQQHCLQSMPGERSQRHWSPPGLDAHQKRPADQPQHTRCMSWPSLDAEQLARWRSEFVCLELIQVASMYTLQGTTLDMAAAAAGKPTATSCPGPHLRARKPPAALAAPFDSAPAHSR